MIREAIVRMRALRSRVVLVVTLALVLGRRGRLSGRLSAAHDGAAPGQVWRSRCARVNPLVVVAVVVAVVSEIKMHLGLCTLELVDVLVGGGAFDVGGRLGSLGDVELRAIALSSHQVRVRVVLLEIRGVRIIEIEVCDGVGDGIGIRIRVRFRLEVVWGGGDS
jgi:hypothetical protein